MTSIVVSKHAWRRNVVGEEDLVQEDMHLRAQVASCKQVTSRKSQAASYKLELQGTSCKLQDLKHEPAATTQYGRSP
jgi:hypothetical protein